MKHIALRARCVHSIGPYTAPGLGDRIHSVIIGWTYSRAHDTPVTLHLTADKWSGGQFSNKADSWAEILALLPAGRVLVRSHPVTPDTEQDWLAYLQRRGIEAELYSYRDFPGKHETVPGFDIAPYLRLIPLLEADGDVELPAKFFTVQWDSNSKARSIAQPQRETVIARYKADGYKPVVVGGEAADSRLRWSLKAVAYAMSKAAFHVGVDSAFFHLAQLYMPWQRIHLYHGDFLSHHGQRARDNGARMNLYL